MPLSIRILKSLCLASLMLAAFDGGRYLTMRGFNVEIPVRTRYDLLLIDLALAFLVTFGVTYLPQNKRIVGAMACIVLAFSVGVGTTVIMFRDVFGYYL
jgi:hypothetical protein